MKDNVLLLVFCQLFCISVLAQSAVSESANHPKALLVSSHPPDTTRMKDDMANTVDSHEEWKDWSTVENHFFGKNRGSLPMIADLRALHPYFRNKIAELIRICKASGITLAIVESYRTPAKQAEYYAMGKKYTTARAGKSRHQYGLAVDVVPIVDSVAVWDNHSLWKKIGIAGERLGLRWGGRWRVLYDPGHFEWVGGLSRRELAQGRFPEIPEAALGDYRNIDAALEILQDNWDAWGVEQSMLANSSTESKRREAAVGAVQ